MIIMHDPIRKNISEKIYQILLQLAKESGAQIDSNEIEKSFSLVFSVQDVYKQLNEPPQSDVGHLAFGTFLAAKALKKSPADIAKHLANQLNLWIDNKPSINNFYLLEAKESGPYLNLKWHSQAFLNEVIGPILKKQTFQTILTNQNTKMMIEYSQPNTHKELHVGHMRNMCLGDSLIRLLRYSGYTILSSTFPGDVGTHVAKCLWYMKHKNTEPIPKDGKGEWLGKMYTKGSLLLEDEEKTEKNEENKKILTEILKQLESKNGVYYELWLETRQWSIDLMKQIYEWADIHFDHWYFESDVDADSVKTIKKYYEEGKFIESQGAIGLDLSNENLGFCLLLKSDGTGLYATKDVELARRKFEDFQIEKSIYVVDQRQALHFKQVFKVLQHLGFDQAKNCYHLQYNYVELPDGAMSSRKGNIVPLTELVNVMRKHIKTTYLSRYENEWSPTEIEMISDQVAKGAIKYGMLKQDTNKKIVFDMKEWTKLDGESGPFIQYSYARICSLIRKLKPDWDFNKSDEFIFQNENKKNSSIFESELNHHSELKLMQHLMNFNTVVLSSAESYKPASLCGYLYDTAKKFNSFYHDCPIAQAENEVLKQQRLMLALATGMVLEQGLKLLGIPSPIRM